MTTRLWGIWTVLSVLGAGCARPYTSQELLGGFSETQEAPDCFRVHFVNTGNPSWDRTHDFTLWRAAELTLQHGFQYFEILIGVDSTGADTGTSSNDDSLPTVFGRTQSQHSEIVIRCFKEQPAEGRILDAEYFVQSLRAKYQMI